MSVLQVNALGYNWQKIKQYIFSVSVNMCGKYKEPVAFVSTKISLEREKIIVETLLNKLAHQLISFAVCKTAWSRKIQWNEIVGKAGYGC